MNKRHDPGTENAFVDKARQLFDESVDGLDGETRSRLNRGRQVALAELVTGRSLWLQWAPAAGVAAAAVVAIVLWTGTQPDYELPPEADFEILLTEDSLEMLEDLEFYSWIDLDEEAEQTQQPEDQVG